MGNPHFVIWLDQFDHADDAGDFRYVNNRAISEFAQDTIDFTIAARSWQEIGNLFSSRFSRSTNVEFVRVLGTQDRGFNQVGIRIFERGVGPTSSSGTGTSATATAMIGVYGASSPLEVASPGGIQTVVWAGPGEKLYLTGPATLVARGEAW